ncbi:protein of unknown function [Xenorhabdus bovienii]|uniref:Uncharacterized protein n=1 Tax=Xenorhabdus bovienii TaxID=40576 RepID=A0A0B6X6B5_XENBV|nr:protein of unknown function [Xenorhabdus bovienii]
MPEKISLNELVPANWIQKNRLPRSSMGGLFDGLVTLFFVHPAESKVIKNQAELKSRILALLTY